MKVLTFGASNSKQSINKQLAAFVAGRIEGADVNLVDLNDFEMPIFGVDREAADGIPAEAHAFYKLVTETDLIVVSFAENNGSFSTAFKNIFDWMTRIEHDAWADKPMLVLGTSPGGRGAQNVVEHASAVLPRFGGKVLGTFTLPSFYDNFADGTVTDEAKLAEINALIAKV